MNDIQDSYVDSFDGTTVAATPDWSTVGTQTAVDGQGNVYYSYQYATFTATVDANQSYTFTDAQGHTALMDGFNPPYVPNWQTITFQVGENHWSHAITVHLADGSTVAAQPDWSTIGAQTACDAFGTTYYTYSFADFTAYFDTNQSYTISDDQGHTALMDGYNPPLPPL